MGLYLEKEGEGEERLEVLVQEEGGQSHMKEYVM
jgi:hypothetical protein